MRRRAGIRRVGSTERRGALQEVQSRSTEKEFRTAIREAKRIRRFRHPAQGILEIREADMDRSRRSLAETKAGNATTRLTRRQRSRGEKRGYEKGIRPILELINETDGMAHELLLYYEIPKRHDKNGMTGFQGALHGVRTRKFWV